MLSKLNVGLTFIFTILTSCLRKLEYKKEKKLFKIKEKIVKPSLKFNHLEKKLFKSKIYFN